MRRMPDRIDSVGSHQQRETQQANAADNWQMPYIEAFTRQCNTHKGPTIGDGNLDNIPPGILPLG